MRNISYNYKLQHIHVFCLFCIIEQFYVCHTVSLHISCTEIEIYASLHHKPIIGRVTFRMVEVNFVVNHESNFLPLAGAKEGFCINRVKPLYQKNS